MFINNNDKIIFNNGQPDEAVIEWSVGLTGAEFCGLRSGVIRFLPKREVCVGEDDGSYVFVKLEGFKEVIVDTIERVELVSLSKVIDKDSRQSVPESWYVLDRSGICVETKKRDGEE